MIVTEVKIHLVHDKKCLKANATIVLFNSFVIHDLKVIELETTERMFVAMPSKKLNDKWVDIAHPLNKKSRAIIENAVLDKYKQKIKESQNEK